MTTTDILKEENIIEDILNQYLQKNITESFNVGQLIQYANLKIKETNLNIESDISLIVKSVIWSLVDSGEAEFTKTRKIKGIYNNKRKIFHTDCCDGTYYVSELGKKGLQIDNMTRTDLFNLWWSVFKEWITGDQDYG